MSSPRPQKLDEVYLLIAFSLIEEIVVGRMGSDWIGSGGSLDRWFGLWSFVFRSKLAANQWAKCNGNIKMSVPYIETELQLFLLSLSLFFSFRFSTVAHNFRALC